MDNWKNIYQSHEIFDISKLNYHNSWNDFFGQTEVKKELKKINKTFTTLLQNNISIFPYPKDVFNAFVYTPLNDIRVVCIGQDPYFNSYNINNQKIPEAMGLSFSVPKNIKIPSSLNNIFKNALKYKHFNKYPSHGNLESWAKQGVFLFNTALTVQEGVKLSHAKIWNVFSDLVIKYISDNCNNIVFVLWGAHALSKKSLIDNSDGKKHEFVISSHPSGLSCNKKLNMYTEFNNLDQFGEINKYLIKHNKKQIDWTID